MPDTQEETTLILLKPDCVRKNLSGTILKRFLSEGFRLRGIKMIQLDEPVLREHYAHILDLVINGEPLFPKLLDFMTSSPVIAIALKGPNKDYYTVGIGWSGESGPALVERCYHWKDLDTVIGIFEQAFQKDNREESFPVYPAVPHG